MSNALSRSMGLRFREPIPLSSQLVIAGSSLIALLVLWAGWSSHSDSSARFVPAIHSVLITAVRMFAEQQFLLDIGASSLRILVAFGASALLAVPLGLVMSSFRVFDALIAPLFEFVRYVPVPALAPFFVLVTGIGEETKFLVLFFGTFFQLVLIIKDDADRVPNTHIELARTLGARTSGVLTDVLLPFLLPTIYDRLRVTLGWCWTYLVIAELIAVESGVGHVIKEAQRFQASDQLFVCLISLGAIGLATDVLAKMGYRQLFPYSTKPGALRGDGV